jgi:hypothetical protein
MHLPHTHNHKETLREGIGHARQTFLKTKVRKQAEAPERIHQSSPNYSGAEAVYPLFLLSANT